MSSVRISLSLILICILNPLLAAEPEKPDKKPAKPAKEQIARWVRQLGDNDFNLREEATQKLWEAGDVAEPALQEAFKSDDAEVSRRAKEVLDKFKWGIYPNTPKNIVELLTRYQGGDQNTKMGIIGEMIDAGPAGCKALLKLAAVEENAQVKQHVLSQISLKLPRSLPLLLAANDQATLETLLQIGLDADVETSYGNAVAYWLMRGQLDERLAHYKKLEAKGDKAKLQAKLLAYLYRAKGDFPAAIEAAKRTDQPSFIQGLLAESGDWKELARMTPAADSGRELETLGFRAAYHRLAGNSKEFEDTLNQLQKLAEATPANNDEQLFYIAKVFFLNQRPKEALAILARCESHQPDLFEILAAQLKYREALALVEKARTAGSKKLPQLEILQARTLYFLGEKDKALPIFNRLAAEIKPGTNLDWFEQLVEAEARVGLTDQAFAHAAEILSVSKDEGMPGRLFDKLFGSQQKEPAESLWQIYKALFPLDNNATNLKRLRDLLAGKTPAKDVRQLVTNAETAVKGIKAEEAQKWQQALAEAALAAKLEELAHSCLEKSGSAAGLQRLGDLLAAKKQWKQAAERYYQAWEKDRQEALPLYLSGKALVEAGQEKEGKQRIETSHFLPLGNESARDRFDKELLQRGQTEASRREVELAPKLCQPGSYYSGEALRRVALDLLQRKDLLRAADYQERSMLRVLGWYIHFLAKPAYVGVPCLIARQRASGLLAGGKTSEAMQLLALCQECLPGSVEVPIQLLPEMEKNNLKKEAADLFEKTAAIYEKLCDEYPRCPWTHNSIAWLSACCRRNLDNALTHGLKAVELAPTNAGHIDTLAEVYFQRGDKEKAVELEKKVVSLEPRRIYFRKQLKRLEAGDPKAPLPSENEEDEED